MGFLLTRVTCPCGAVSEASDDHYIWKYQHKRPDGVFCRYYFDGHLEGYNA